VSPSLLDIAAWLRRQADHVAVLLLATMFVAFLCQIVFRYVFGWPTGWAFELSIITWLWGVLWGAAFVVRERDEIRFDIVYSLFPAGLRRLCVVATGVMLIALYGISLPAVADYVAFMKVEKSAYLGIRLNWLYAVYVIFVVAVLARYFWLVWRALKGDTPATLVDPGT
jgi:TRAP-type C4-dicarboxylate transport system permease small subunit